jgi:hypothetical protein
MKLRTDPPRHVACKGRKRRAGPARRLCGAFGVQMMIGTRQGAVVVFGIAGCLSCAIRGPAPREPAAPSAATAHVIRCVVVEHSLFYACDVRVRATGDLVEFGEYFMLAPAASNTFDPSTPAVYAGWSPARIELRDGRVLGRFDLVEPDVRCKSDR